MKIFISWSGDLSNKVAVALREWIPNINSTFEPHVSSEDIAKGSHWSNDLARELENTSYGIVCVTKDNFKSPWLNYEAGALSKNLDEARVCPFLLNVERSEIEGPLTRFQVTKNTKGDIFKLIISLNNLCTEHKLTDERLNKAFERSWPEFEKALNEMIDEKNLDHIFNDQALREILILFQSYLEKESATHEMNFDKFSEQRVTQFKMKILHDVMERLRQLNTEMCIKHLTPEESFYWSIKMLENLKKDDEVMAVTFMEDKKGEWEKTNLWDNYINAHKMAAQKEAIVDRIFIIKKEILHHELEKEIMKLHTEGQYKDGKMNGFFLDIQDFNICSYQLRERIGEGFILINSKSTQEMIAVIDDFSHRGDPDHLDYRTSITFNRDDHIYPMMAFFKIIKAMSTPLTKEILKSKFDIEI